MNTYAQLRTVLFRRYAPPEHATVLVRDAATGYTSIPISERLVQCVWYDQRLRVHALHITDGQSLQVVFQGWWNLEDGPDFTHATVQVGPNPETSGDIEVHLRADDWFHHGHHRDPRYNRVVLHVVLWRFGSERAPQTSDGRTIPQVVLEDQLGATLDALHDEIDLETYPHSAGHHGGRCAQTLRRLPAETLRALLDQAGDERFASKVRRFTRWIHRAGPEQAFYEGWMEALGYKANKSTFRELARRLPLAVLNEHRRQLVPALFGCANFLPVISTRDPYTKKLWNAWWKLRPGFADRVLPANAWKLHGLRPPNHPHRRLGAAAALLRKYPRLLENVLDALASAGDPAKLFRAGRDEYWSRHFRLGGKRQSQAVELIGAARAQEIMANIVLPFVAAYARQRDDDALERQIIARYVALRPAPSNSVVRLAGQQLFDTPATWKKLIITARQQQGLLQVFHDFCLNDKSACERCLFPELIADFAGRG